MLINTEGIVLHSFKYSNTSIITRIYTKELGLQSYLVPGVRKKKATFKFNLFQPLSLFEIIVYHKERDGLQRIKEISSLNQYNSINTDIRKTTIAIFLSEILTNCLKEQESNPELFNFLKQSFIFLDKTETKITNFHLIFLLQLTKYLGFYPNLKENLKNTVFNLKEGVFQNNKKKSLYHLDNQLSDVFFKLCKMDYTDIDKFSLHSKERKQILEKTMDYYKLHMAGFKEIKSLYVLETVFN